MSKHESMPEITTNLRVPPPRGPYEGRHRLLWMEPGTAETVGLAGLIWVAVMMLAYTCFLLL